LIETADNMALMRKYHAQPSAFVHPLSVRRKSANCSGAMSAGIITASRARSAKRWLNSTGHSGRHEAGWHALSAAQVHRTERCPQDHLKAGTRLSDRFAPQAAIPERLIPRFVHELASARCRRALCDLRSAGIQTGVSEPSQSADGVLETAISQCLIAEHLLHLPESPR
jgi:hypothetical protein